MTRRLVRAGGTVLFASVLLAPMVGVTVRSGSPAGPGGRIVRLDPRLDRLVPAGARLEPVAEGFSWVEGPVWDRRAGVLLFSDIPQNAGTMIRMAACLGVAVEIVEPAAFDVSDRNFRRSGMDHLERAAVTRHDSFRAFEAWRAQAGHRLVLAETDGVSTHTDFAFRTGDVVMVGRESAGVPPEVYAAAEASVHIPMRFTSSSDVTVSTCSTSPGCQRGLEPSRLAHSRSTASCSTRRQRRKGSGRSNGPIASGSPGTTTRSEPSRFDRRWIA